MILYRIANKMFSNDLSGNGARLYGGRWNSQGTPLLYCSEHISLALLEMMIHTRLNDYSITLDLVYINLPDSIAPKDILLSKLKSNWREDTAYTRFIGDEFARQKKNMVMRIPSAVIPEENNFLINPQHTLFGKLSILQIKSFRPDKRLFTI